MKPSADSSPRRLDFFERYLSFWVLLCMGIGIGLGQRFSSLIRELGALQFGRDSHVNIPIAVLLWLMIYPMMLRIDFGGLAAVLQRPRGLVITLIVNWLVKPLSMAALGSLFLRVIFGRGLGLVSPADAKDYTAGLRWKWKLAVRRASTTFSAWLSLSRFIRCRGWKS